ncbi:MAG: hypothetical protein GC189_00930 [Alphaproteobacteria bacterium]|nr:hypothetical protein [Alphaproteobacteria bacterium]
MSAASDLALAAAAREVDALSSAGERLEKLLARLTRLGALDADAIMQAQAIDLLAQTMQELARFMRSVATDFDADSQAVIVRALADVRLADLAQRLDVFCSGAPETPPENNGVELF